MSLLERFDNLCRRVSKTSERAERTRLVFEFVRREAEALETSGSTTLRLFDEFRRLGRGGPLLQAELARVRKLETVEAGDGVAQPSSSQAARSVAPMVFRRVDVDPDVDAAVRADARDAKVSNGEMFRRYLRAGIERAERGAMLEPLGQDLRLVMRSVYLSAEIEEWLRARAFAVKARPNSVVRQLLRLGMQALRTQAR